MLLKKDPNHGHTIGPVSALETNSIAIYVRALYGAEINPTRKRGVLVHPI